MTTRRLTVAVATVLSGAVACRPEPPAVQVEGPDEVLAGGDASFHAILTPAEDGARITWSAAWSRTAPGQKACEVLVGEASRDRAIANVDAACEGGEIVITARVTARGGVVTTRKVARVRPVEAPAWPDPLPPSWRVLNDYEAPAEPRVNRFGGAWGTWGFKGGKCRVEVSGGVLKVTYSLPMGDSECGTFEYLKGAAGRPEPLDIRPFERVAFLLKSGDGQGHRVSLEVVELDPYAQALQGYVGATPAWTSGPDWKRYEARLDDLLHPRFDRKMGKQVGLRIRRKDQDQASGVVLVDNLTLIERGQAP